MAASYARSRGSTFWLSILGLTVILTLEPGLFLVGLALALSGLTLVWIALLVRALLMEYRSTRYREPRGAPRTHPPAAPPRPDLS